MKRPGQSTNFETGPAGRRRGTAATELALILPVLLVIGLGAVDFGHAAHVRRSLLNGARNGAEYAATHRWSWGRYRDQVERVEEAVRDELGSVPGLDPQHVRIRVWHRGELSQLPVTTVTVTYTFQPLIDWPGLPRRIHMRQRISMRQFR